MSPTKALLARTGSTTENLSEGCVLQLEHLVTDFNGMLELMTIDLTRFYGSYWHSGFLLFHALQGFFFRSRFFFIFLKKITLTPALL